MVCSFNEWERPTLKMLMGVIFACFFNNPGFLK